MLLRATLAQVGPYCLVLLLTVYIALVTISHRPTLRKFHTWELAIGQGPDGRGWELRRIDAASTGDGPSSPAAHSLHEELTALQAAMAQRPALLARRQHVESLLNPGKKTLPVA